MFDLQIETAAGHRGQIGVAVLVQQALASLDDDLDLAQDGLRSVEWMLPPPDHREVRAGGLAPWQVKRACAYIETHLAEPMALATLAQQVRLSTGAFARAFRQSLGHPPWKYVRIKRVEHAQRLMTTTDMRLCDIAIACGFSDQAHFSRTFNYMTSTTPARWRRAMATWRPQARTAPRERYAGAFAEAF